VAKVGRLPAPSWHKLSNFERQARKNAQIATHQKKNILL
jgi:hypothetical protein